MKTLLYEKCELELNFRLSAEMWQIILKFIYEHAYTVYAICMRTAQTACVCVRVCSVCANTICTTVYEWQINQNHKVLSFQRGALFHL